MSLCCVTLSLCCELLGVWLLGVRLLGVWLLAVRLLSIDVLFIFIGLVAVFDHADGTDDVVAAFDVDELYTLGVAS